MHSTLIVARMDAASGPEVARLFGEFDRTEMPARMHVRRRQLFTYQGLYFHLQDFAGADGGGEIEAAREHPLFRRISADLKPYVGAYDPETWRSPADAMAAPFYHWAAPE